MLKKSASFLKVKAKVKAEKRRVRSSLNLNLDLSLPSLAVALLDGLFEHPAWCSPVVLDMQTKEALACSHGFPAAC